MSHGSMTAAAQAALARLNAARPEKVKSYKGDFLPVGNHTLLIAELDRYGTDDTLKVKVLGKYLASDNPTVEVGKWWVRVWELTKPPAKPGMSTQADEFVEFLHKVTSTPFNVDMAQQRGDLLYHRFNDQLLRGMRVTCHGTYNQKKTYVRTAWDSIPQTQAEISQWRAQLDATDPWTPRDAAQAAPAAPPQPQYAQMPQAQVPSNNANFGYPQVNLAAPMAPSAFPPGFPGAPQMVQAFAPQQMPVTSPGAAVVAFAPQTQAAAGGPPPGWPPGYPWPPPAQAPTGTPLLAGVPGHQKP